MTDSNRAPDAPTSSLILIGGPTASGKTSLGVRLAKALDGEVISADSVQLFRGVEVGAATPSMGEREGVPHHLLSVIDPKESVTAAEFQKLADDAIADVHARGKVAIIVGGSGLYLKALLYGLAQAPARDDALRARLEAQADQEGNEALWRSLEASDPKAAAALHPNDRVRVIRALEVWSLTGTSITDRQQEHGFERLRYRVAGIGLTAPRPWIHARVDQRVSMMLDAGLLDEVRALLDAGVPIDAQPLTAIGLRESAAFLAPDRAPARVGRDERVPQTLDELRQAIQSHTRNFARRQLVMFRKEKYFRWFDAQNIESKEPALLASLRAFLAGEDWSGGVPDERAISGEAPTVRRGRKPR